MSLLIAIIVGIIIGAGGSFLLEENLELIAGQCLSGVVGAILGGAIWFFTSGSPYFLFSWGGLVSSVVGAIIAVLLFSLLNRTAPRHVTHHGNEMEEEEEKPEKG